MVCDSISGELQGLSVAFCNSNGTLRYDDIDGLEEEQDTAASHGGFVHVYDVMLNEEHRHKDVGIKCLTALLDWVATLGFRNDGSGGSTGTRRRADGTPKKTKGWTLCVIEPSGLTAAESSSDRMVQFNDVCAMMQGHFDDESTSREEDLRSRRAVANKKIQQQFARMGFKQRGFNSSSFYLIPSMLLNHPMSKEEVVERVTITTTTESPVLCAAERRLFKYLQETSRRVSLAQFQAMVTEQIMVGADLSRCNGLHALVANMANSDSFEASKVEWILSQGVEINAKDSDGNTVLHVAANFNKPSTVRELIGLGADAKVKNLIGKTPLDVANDSFQDMRDFMGAMGISMGMYRGNDLREMNETLRLLE